MSLYHIKLAPMLRLYILWKYTHAWQIDRQIDRTLTLFFRRQLVVLLLKTIPNICRSCYSTSSAISLLSSPFLILLLLLFIGAQHRIFAVFQFWKYRVHTQEYGDNPVYCRHVSSNKNMRSKQETMEDRILLDKIHIFTPLSVSGLLLSSNTIWRMWANTCTINNWFCQSFRHINVNKMIESVHFNLKSTYSKPLSAPKRKDKM